MKTIMITGATDGIGRHTALRLAEMGHVIILHGRKNSRGMQVREDLIRRTENEHIHYFNADLTDLTQVRQLAGQVSSAFGHLDVLLNNAGVLEPEKILLANGMEKTFMVNHLAHFSLTLQLLDLLRSARAGRIVNVSSQAQAGSIDFDNLNGEKHYDGYTAYTVSKLANILFTYKLARALQGTGMTTHALHPGVIATKLLHAGWGGGGAPLDRSAKTMLFVTTSDALEEKNGLYFVDARQSRSSAISYDVRIQERLWDISLELCRLADPFRS